MAGELQPLDEKFAIVGPDGRPTLYFIQWAQQRQIDITESTTVAQVIQLIEDHPTTWGEIVGILADQGDLQDMFDTKANLAGGNNFTGDQTVTGKMQVRGSAISQFRQMATVQLPTDPQPNYGFSETSLGLNNPAAATPDQLLFAFGAEGIYDAAGVISRSNFYIYDIVNFVYRMFADALTGVIYLGGTDAGGPSSAGLIIENSGHVTIPGTGFVGVNEIYHMGNLGVFDASNDGLVPASGGGTVNFLRADGTFAAPPGGGGGGGGVLPVVDGSIPPVFLQNPDGSLIYAPI